LDYKASFLGTVGKGRGKTFFYALGPLRSGLRPARSFALLRNSDFFSREKNLSHARNPVA
jgi:hypothetical protein